MAAYFLDSSALIKRYVQENGTQWVRRTTEPDSGHQQQPNCNGDGIRKGYPI